MAAGVFTIIEIADTSDPTSIDTGETFSWVADPKPIVAFDGSRGGGAKACPIQPWGMPAEQRVKRTNYPNAVRPSAQILGPIHGQHSFSGRWDDRYNGAGYAKFERDRFRAMCERGNFVRISYDAFVFDGIIIKWDTPVRRAWDISYQFTVDVYNTPQNVDTTRVPPTPSDPISTLNNHDTAVQATLDADSVAPRNSLTKTTANDVSTALVGMVNAREQVALTIDQRDVRPPESPVDAFARIASQFRTARAAAYNLVLALGVVRSDVSLAHQTALSVLDFEDWSRSLRFAARTAMGTARVGADAAAERADPSAVKIYRPSQGEHLYAIARKFYGTPHAWRLVYDRNALTSITMTGSEVLIMPERGGT